MVIAHSLGYHELREQQQEVLEGQYMCDHMTSIACASAEAAAAGVAGGSARGARGT